MALQNFQISLFLQDLIKIFQDSFKTLEDI